jgi:hypothetical protein
LQDCGDNLSGLTRVRYEFLDSKGRPANREESQGLITTENASLDMPKFLERESALLRKVCIEGEGRDMGDMEVKLQLLLCWLQKSLLDCSRSKPEAHQFMSRFVYKGGDRMELKSEQCRSLRKLGWNNKDM